MKRTGLQKFFALVLAVSVVAGGFTMSAMAAPVTETQAETIHGGTAFFKCPVLEDGSMACAMQGTGCLSCAEFTQIETPEIFSESLKAIFSPLSDLQTGWIEARLVIEPDPPK